MLYTDITWNAINKYEASLKLNENEHLMDKIVYSDQKVKIPEEIEH